MLKSLLDSLMERRARDLLDHVGDWLPSEGSVLDLGSGTGHLAAQLQRNRKLDVVTADVSDFHVVGPPPVILGDGVLPFERGTFTAALLVFMLGYPSDPVRVLMEAARVTRGPVILVQTVYSGRFGQAWHRCREFVWTIVAFNASRIVGYVRRDAEFSMHVQRFYTADTLARDVAAAGLRVNARRERPVLPGHALVVVGWMLERHA